MKIKDKRFWYCEQTWFSFVTWYLHAFNRRTRKTIITKENLKCAKEVKMSLKLFLKFHCFSILSLTCIIKVLKKVPDNILVRLNGLPSFILIGLLSRIYKPGLNILSWGYWQFLNPYNSRNVSEEKISQAQIFIFFIKGRKNKRSQKHR